MHGVVDCNQWSFAKAQKSPANLQNLFPKWIEGSANLQDTLLEPVSTFAAALPHRRAVWLH